MIDTIPFWSGIALIVTSPVLLLLMIERLEKCFRIYFPKKMALLLDNNWRSLHILACIAFAIGCVSVAFNKSLRQSELPFLLLPLMLSAIVYLAPLGLRSCSRCSYSSRIISRYSEQSIFSNDESSPSLMAVNAQFTGICSHLQPPRQQLNPMPNRNWHPAAFIQPRFNMRQAANIGGNHLRRLITFQRGDFIRQ